MAASVSTRLAGIEEQIDDVAAKIENEVEASPAFRAVFEELHRKTREARDELKGADEASIRDHVIEVEQAADSAKLAAEAEEGLSDKVRDAVLDVHDALSELKAELGD